MRSTYRQVLTDAAYDAWERRAILVEADRQTRMPPVPGVAAAAP